MMFLNKQASPFYLFTIVLSLAVMGCGGSDIGGEPEDGITVSLDGDAFGGFEVKGPGILKVELCEWSANQDVWSKIPSATLFDEGNHAWKAAGHTVIPETSNRVWYWRIGNLENLTAGKSYAVDASASEIGPLDSELELPKQCTVCEATSVKDNAWQQLDFLAIGQTVKVNWTANADKDLGIVCVAGNKAPNGFIEVQ